MTAEVALLRKPVQMKEEAFPTTEAASRRASEAALEA
jgi:hypothetical protein